MDMDCSERDQCLAGTAFRDHHGCPRLLPAFGHSHDGNGLRWERPSEQSFNTRRNCIVKLMERWILPQNAVSQERRVTSHVVVNCGQFRHGSPLVRGGVFGRERENKGKEGKDGWCGKLVGRQEEVFETQTRPADRTSFSRKADGSTLKAPTEPGKEQFLLPFDQ